MPAKVIAVLGPTASGKSDLAINLARRFKGEVISADSRQVYRGLDIGTGKISRREMRGVRHHLLDVASPLRTFTAAQYQKLAARAIKDILRRGKLPIICGGTGFYLDALLYDYVLPEVKPNAKLRQKLQKLSPPALFAKLQKLDPERAQGIDPRNPRRLIRAIEIASKLGKVPKIEKKYKYEILKIGTRVPDAKLKDRIKIRLLSWLRRGLVREIGTLCRAGISRRRFEEFGLDYKYGFYLFNKEIIRAEMIEHSTREIWNYAKRQMTWFKRDPEIHWIRSPREAVSLVKDFLK